MASLLFRNSAQRALLSKRYLQSSSRALSMAPGHGSKIEATKHVLKIQDSTPTAFNTIRTFASQSSAKTIGNEEPKSFVDGEINKYPVVIFAYESCPYCIKAKQVLNKYKLTPKIYAIHDIDNHKNLNGILDYLKQKTGQRSLPRVFIKGRCIGGGTETVRLDESGELNKMLQEIVPKDEASTS